MRARRGLSRLQVRLRSREAESWMESERKRSVANKHHNMPHFQKRRPPLPDQREPLPPPLSPQSSSMAASVLTVHVMLHMATAADATVDRTLQFFPKICQLIHNPPTPPTLPSASASPRHNASPFISGSAAASTLISNNISSASVRWLEPPQPPSGFRSFAQSDSAWT